MAYFSVNKNKRALIKANQTEIGVSAQLYPTPKEIEVIKEVSVERLVPFETIREIIKEIEVIKEVEKPIFIEKETIIYVDKPYPVEVIKEVEKRVEIPVETIRIVDRFRDVKYIPKSLYLLVVVQFLAVIMLLLNK